MRDLSEKERRDHRQRWFAVAARLVFAVGLAALFSLKEGFFDPWFFVMVTAPVPAGVSEYPRPPV
jgi:hypothetical protein